VEEEEEGEDESSGFEVEGVEEEGVGEKSSPRMNNEEIQSPKRTRNFAGLILLVLLLF
jgi:hypothetical protein